MNCHINKAGIIIKKHTHTAEARTTYFMEPICIGLCMFINTDTYIDNT